MWPTQIPSRQISAWSQRSSTRKPSWTAPSVSVSVPRKDSPNTSRAVFERSVVSLLSFESATLAMGAIQGPCTSTCAGGDSRVSGSL